MLAGARERWIVKDKKRAMGITLGACMCEVDTRLQLARFALSLTPQAE